MIEPATIWFTVLSEIPAADAIFETASALVISDEEIMRPKSADKASPFLSIGTSFEDLKDIFLNSDMSYSVFMSL